MTIAETASGKTKRPIKTAAPIGLLKRKLTATQKRRALKKAKGLLDSQWDGGVSYQLRWASLSQL
jgi:hypothetical protein